MRRLLNAIPPWVWACAAAAVVWLAVGAAFHVGVGRLVPEIPPQFKNAALFRPWPGWTMAYMCGHPLWYGPAFALGYCWLRRRGLLTGLRGGARYGLAVFALGGLPGYLLSFASFQVSPEVVASWLVQSLCQHLLTGAVVGRVAEWPAAGTDSHAP